MVRTRMNNDMLGGCGHAGKLVRKIRSERKRKMTEDEIIIRIGIYLTVGIALAIWVAWEVSR